MDLAASETLRGTGAFEKTADRVTGSSLAHERTGSIAMKKKTDRRSPAMKAFFELFTLSPINVSIGKMGQGEEYI